MELIGCSILDTAWIDRVTANGNSCFLLLAEGLFPWLPEPEVRKLLQLLSQRFSHSQLVLDCVPEKYLKGLWNRLLRLETRITMGIDIYWVFGIKQPRDLESYAPGLRVLGEVKGSAGPIITISINGGNNYGNIS